ncbi:F-box protein At1g78280-like [Zingiber officinale]|uniref:F-box protein n=1 Tax=Zingiber officinale TaxID=94328 RepID=A0A8J5GVS9_ZINOF|nr:F-box protein At1g78280-like [Zingiber officinale]KAG6510861.1 hypothetical protein ZIOFF_028906 [Zingiber officinale]
MEPPAIRDRRPDALGDLRVLPDEIICDVLDLLTPRDLARLSCVSSVMYILCNEEPLWMSQCLRDGGQLEFKDTWKKTTLHRKNLCTKVEVCEKPLQFDGFNSWFLYKRWYRCFTTLDAFTLDSGDMERHKSVTMEEFHSEYDCKKPVLLTELANTWPARTKWTIKQLSLDYGDITFRISQRSSQKIKMKLRDYVSYMEGQHDEDPLYIFDDKFGESASPLLDDYSVPYLFREDFFEVLDLEKRPPFRWLIIGPQRSGASWHVDPALTSAWNTLLVGRKRWALYPPGRVPAGVTVHVNEEDGDVNIESPSSLQWWLDIYPQLSDHDKPIECTQLPGETIFVPSGWWHCVLNLETTIAVTQNFVNKSNFEFVCLDMTPGHCHKGVCRAGLLAVGESIPGDARDHEFSKMKLLDDSDLLRKAKRLKGSDILTKPFQPNAQWHAGNVHAQPLSMMQMEKFSYDISFLSKFLEENRDHYNSAWSPDNSIGQREMQEWLRKLWISKQDIRELIWKGAQLALNIDKWYACLVEVCACHNLPPPLDDEKFPVGTGSNPVFLVSDFVIKIYVEGNLDSSIHGLGTELEFYHFLRSTTSPLKDHIPDVLASGILANENGFLRIYPWDGKEIPNVIANCKLIGDCMTNSFPFGIWSKIKTELTDQVTSEPRNIWPYIVTKRCKGDIFANLREGLSMNDALHLASFLGNQLRNLHSLPLPEFCENYRLSIKNDSLQAVHSEINIPVAWELIIMTLNRRRRDVRKRLSVWGDPIPRHLIEKADAYLPTDLRMLLDFIKDDNGLYTVSTPTWIHSDIMDDNILMEYCQPIPSFGHPSCSPSTANGELIALDAEQNISKLQATHIIDFSDLSIGDPLYDLIPIYLDVFRGELVLFKQFLESYGLPLSKASMNGWLPCTVSENLERYKRTSYRTMCYCILHDENVLGAIFSMWKELRTAETWEEVEETVWGELNNYQCPR